MGDRDGATTIYVRLAHCLAGALISSFVCLFFFFSSRRRHTRFDCDWSSDVCSSDLTTLQPWVEATLNGPRARAIAPLSLPGLRAEWQAVLTKQRPFDFRVWRWLNQIGRASCRERV